MSDVSVAVGCRSQCEESIIRTSKIQLLIIKNKNYNVAKFITLVHLLHIS